MRSLICSHNGHLSILQNSTYRRSTCLFRYLTNKDVWGFQTCIIIWIQAPSRIIGIGGELQHGVKRGTEAYFIKLRQSGFRNFSCKITPHYSPISSLNKVIKKTKKNFEKPHLRRFVNDVSLLQVVLWVRAPDTWLYSQIIYLRGQSGNVSGNAKPTQRLLCRCLSFYS